jgi:hypothetical protein
MRRAVSVFAELCILNKEATIFDRDDIEKYEFEGVPLDRDIYLMDEKFIHEYERNMVNFLEGSGDFENIGYISYAAARSVNPHSIELSWYPNIFDRFHEVRLFLPRSDFVLCVGAWTIDEKPRIFVKGGWFDAIHERTYSAYAMVDAIGVKAAILEGRLTRELLLLVRHEVDVLADRYPNVAFISFADTLLIKYNWSYLPLGSPDYDYNPELILLLIRDINDIYRKILGMETYAAIAQGGNEYYADDLLHISGNHVSLNSLGLPFAQIQSIDEAARKNIRNKVHEPAEVYMDDQFLASLRLRFGFEKKKLHRANYAIPMVRDLGSYVMATRTQLIENLDPEPSPLRKKSLENSGQST